MATDWVTTVGSDGTSQTICARCFKPWPCEACEKDRRIATLEGLLREWLRNWSPVPGLCRRHNNNDGSAVCLVHQVDWPCVVAQTRETLGLEGVQVE